MSVENQVKQLPQSPGVYFFKKGRSILYIGKATSLRERVRSYLSNDLVYTRGPRIVKMIEEADSVGFEVTDSALEAMILEANLIKRHQPPYNVKEKDDKSYNYIIFTKEDYPRIFAVRGRELQMSIDPDDIKYLFGPYPSGASLRAGLTIIRKIFPFRGENDPVELDTRRHSPLKRQIGLVPDFSVISKKEYQNTVRNLKLFFEGKKGKLLKELAKDMKRYAKREEFEKASKVKRQLFALEHIRDISLIKDDYLDPKPLKDEGFRIEAYDIAHMSGKAMAGVMTVVEDGNAQKQEYRMFKIKSVDGSNDTAALKEVLRRRFAHNEWKLPRLIVMDGGKAQHNAAEAVLQEFGYSITIVSVVKNERHQVREILGDRDVVRMHENDIILANSEAHRFAQNYHKKLRRIV